MQMRCLSANNILARGVVLPSAACSHLKKKKLQYNQIEISQSNIYIYTQKHTVHFKGQRNIWIFHLLSPLIFLIIYCIEDQQPI